MAKDPIWKHRKDRNDTSNPGFDYEAWKIKHTAFADVAVPKWVDAVKQQYGTDTTGFACVGYCFGAPYVCDELAKDTVTVGAFAHPAFLKEHHFLNVKSEGFLYLEDSQVVAGTLVAKDYELISLCQSPSSYPAPRLTTRSMCHLVDER